MAVILLATALEPRPAAAQLPVCPPPSDPSLVYIACPKGAGFLAKRFLTAFAIDHTFKPVPPKLIRTPAEIFRALSQEGVAGDAMVAAYLDDLEPLEFTKLDTSTGVLQSEVPASRRRFRWSWERPTVRSTVSIEFPEKVEGGYWRTPDALQVAFWEGHRVRFKIQTPNGGDLRMTVACLAITGEGIRLVAASPRAPHANVTFAGCK